jgi:biotin carboxyl carrier protein
LRYQVRSGTKRHRIEIDKSIDLTCASEVQIDKTPYLVQLLSQNHSGKNLNFAINNCIHSIQVRRRPDGFPYKIIIDGNAYPVEIERVESTRYKPPIPERKIDGRVEAILPGVIRALLVGEGDKVRKGQPLLILEAMKMENEITAPCDGIVKNISVKPDQLVPKSHFLLEVDNA